MFEMPQKKQPASRLPTRIDDDTEIMICGLQAICACRMHPPDELERLGPRADLRLLVDRVRIVRDALGLRKATIHS